MEDERLLTGEGKFTANINGPNFLHAIVLRSPHACADILSIDVSQAYQIPGVEAVFTYSDLVAAGVNPLSFHDVLSEAHGYKIAAPERYVLSRNQVRYVGEPVALVIARTRTAAVDASELIQVNYLTRNAVCGVENAIQKNAPQLWSGAANNVAGMYEYGDRSAVSEAFRKAAHVVSLKVTNNRVVPNPLEPRASIAHVDSVTNKITLQTSNQTPHMARSLLAEALGLPEAMVRIQVQDIGGAFGSKVAIYPEDVLVAFAALKLGASVRWVADRSEAFISDAQGRDHFSECQLALDIEGYFLALSVRDLADMGAYISYFGAAIATRTGNRIANGAYHIPQIHAEIRIVLTNTVPTGPYRGAGRPETVYRLERLIDLAAMKCGFDRVELRRKNLISSAQIPYTNVVGQTYDSGNFHRVLERAIVLADVSGLESRRAAALTRGKLLGWGLAYHIDTTSGIAPSETVKITATKEGATILSGTQAMGQGLETVYAQLASQILGIDPKKIHVKQGDTDLIETGIGSYGSRSLYIGGAAVVQAARELANLGGEGCATSTASSPFCFPNGCHVCEVEIDQETGLIQISRYTAVDDVGTAIHPIIIDGQTWGGVVQGIGQALMECAVYDQETSQPIAGSFMDYAMPRSDLLVDMQAELDQGAPSTTNILGAKGAGESGALGAPPAVVSAVVDALHKNYGVYHIDMPLWPEKIWRIIKST
jgi:carbon-monoxide dehydrogenase large subunit